MPRNGLIIEVLRVTGRSSRDVLPPPDDLPKLDWAFARGRGRQSYRALKHFHRVADRDDYNVNLFSSLRYIVMDTRQLVLLVQTRQPVADFLLPEHKLSQIDFKTAALG